MFVSVTRMEAAEDAGDNVPVVIHRLNRRPWVAIIFLDALIDLAAAVTRIWKKPNNI